MTPSTLLDEIAAIADCRGWLVRSLRRPEPGHDLMLVPRSPGWREDRDATGALERLAAAPEVASVAISGERALVRLDDAAVARRGRLLESGDASLASELVAGRRFAVHFCDPNATKPLHVGHLRNLALGNALAATLAQAGATVERRSTIADFGRSMAEALAGVEAREQSGHVRNGEKPDHYVGACYADYVTSTADPAQEATALDGPLARELQVSDDEADALLGRMAARDPVVTELWARVRGLVVDGQLATLRRLGIEFDALIRESDLLETADAMIRVGLREGLFETSADGAVVYPTGREDYDCLSLTRTDGLANQHLRCMAIWLATQEELGTATTLQVVGDEWGPHCTVTEPLLERLMAQTGAVHPTMHVLHGMVTERAAKVSSSAGTARSIDGLLDWLADEGPRRARADGWDAGSVDPGAVALGYFLARPRTATMEYDRERLFDPRVSPGWLIARARRHLAAAVDDAGDVACDPAYRFAVVQWEEQRTYVRRACERYDLSDLTRWAGHFARWVLEEPRPARVARAADAVLAGAEAAMGIARRS